MAVLSKVRSTRSTGRNDTAFTRNTSHVPVTAINPAAAAGPAKRPTL
jgi:hypothetical protein